MEVITAIFIFFCGIVGVLSLFTTALMLHKTSLDRTVSSFAMEQVVAEVRCMVDEGTLREKTTGKLRPVTEGVIKGYPGYTWSALFEEEEGLIKARIRISWKSKGREMGEEFDCLFRSDLSMRREVERLRSETTGFSPEDPGKETEALSVEGEKE